MRRRLALSIASTLLFGAASLAQSGPASLVNVTDPRFGAGCPRPADAFGKADSTCAIRAALRFAESSATPGAGYPVLYFPHGAYRVAGEGYTSALTVTKSISIQGDGAPGTVLLNTSPHAATLTYLQAGDCGGKPGPCPLRIEGMTFAGEGHATAGGLIEIDSTDTGSMRNVVLANTGGIALNLQGSSERWYFSDMEISNTRWPVLLEGDTNETYFERVNVLGGGLNEDYCYSVNCPNGKRIEGGVWLPDPHSAVYLDGDNVHWMNSSIKSTESIGGIRMATITSSLTHTYIEGFPWGAQPRANHAVAAPGPSELGHLTRAVSASSLEIPVDDAGWQPLYVNDPAQARINGQHSYVNIYGIFPADYLAYSHDPSRSVPGITRGTSETVTVGAFSADGQAHLIARGKQPIAWPAGSIMEQVPANGYGAMRLEEDHFNSLIADYDSRYQLGCSDTEPRKQWTSSPSALCAEVIVGLVPDGYMVPYLTETYVRNAFGVDLVDDSIFTGGSEQNGEGWVKIPGNGGVLVEEGNAPLRSFVDAETALHSYSNGVSRVQVVTYPGKAGGKPVSALAYVVDTAAGVRFSPQEGFYTADVMRNGTLDHQYLGSQCWYNTPTGSAAPDRRTCAGAGGGLQESSLVGGRWVAGEGGASAGVGNPVKYVLRDWQVNSLEPRGQAGECQSREQATGTVRFRTAADATLITNLSPNPGAQVTATANIEGDGTYIVVRLCNTGNTAARWPVPPDITLTQLP